MRTYVAHTTLGKVQCMEQRCYKVANFLGGDGSMCSVDLPADASSSPLALNTHVSCTSLKVLVLALQESPFASKIQGPCPCFVCMQIWFYHVYKIQI